MEDDSGAGGEYIVTSAEPTFRRVWAMPNRDTFDIPPIAELVKRHLVGVSVDPFARNKRWATHTNDLNPATDAEHHMEAADFLNMLARQHIVADVVLFDPPYSPRQIVECYQAAGLPTSQQTTQNARLYADCRTAIRRLMRRGSKVLSFGWNSAGMGDDFITEEILLVAHGGAHNDTICLVQRCDRTLVYSPPPLPPGTCTLCFGRGWFLCPGVGGSMTPTACDKCVTNSAVNAGMNAAPKGQQP